MAVARVTLSKAVLSFEGGAATIVVELLEKKDERKLPKWGRDHDQNSVSICTATLMIYRLSFFSHHYFTLRGSRSVERRYCRDLVMKSMTEEKNACVKQI